MSRPVNRKIMSLLLGSLLTALLTHCGETPVKPSTGGSVSKAVAQPSVSPKELIAQAEEKKSPEREALLLQAADIYLTQHKNEKARNLVLDINASQLPEASFIKYSQLLGQIFLADNNLESARRILTNTRVEQQLKALEPQQEAALRELRAQLFERSGQLQDVINERINLSAILTSTQDANTNQEILWRTLMTLPLTELQANATKGSGGITQGWYSLAALSKNNTQDIESQQAALTRWLTQWRTHPAASNLPKDLLFLQNSDIHQPKNIALLLPLQGRLAEAGEAVRDGFFAAYYHQVAQRNLPSVREYDTSAGVIAAYHQALNDGAELIIGPLDKDNVNQISQQKDLPVPLLSLNYPDQQPAQPIANFYQFGLAIEDEARQVARQGIEDGHKRALIISSPVDWSERSAQAFANEWQKLGGTIVDKSNFSSVDRFSENLRGLMLVDESQARKTLLQQQLGTALEFTPRRRADIDMIFMAVTPAQGRQIKPTLAFYYANSIPVYATSTVYSGEPDAANNEDLSGVLFNTLPWVFDNNNPEKTAIAENTKSAAVYGRLQALGADAFHLYARLPQLKQAPQMRIYGATGSLHLLSDGRVEREQMWARFNNGLAEPLASVVDSGPDGDQQ